MPIIENKATASRELSELEPDRINDKNEMISRKYHLERFQLNVSSPIEMYWIYMLVLIIEILNRWISGCGS